MEDTELADDFDQFDQISDDKLWDILDNVTSDNSNKKDLNSIIGKYNNICSECKSANLVFTSGRGSYVCENCGTKGQDFLDDGPEWNNYEDGKSDSGRCGAPINAFFPKSSLGTIINAPGYSKVKMLRNWGQVPYRERSLAEILNDIDAKCKKYKITKAIIDNAKILYKNVKETKHTEGASKGKNVIIRGLNCEQVIASCFYFGANLQKSPRSTKEVADIFNMDTKRVSKGNRKFLEIMKDNFIVFDIKPSHGTDFVERFGIKLKLTKETIELANIIANNTTKLDIASDHQATSIAAASLLFASDILSQNNINKQKNIQQTDVKSVSKTFGISPVTIMKTYKKISPFEQFVISDEKTNKLCHKINLKLMTDNINKDDCEDGETDISNIVVNEKEIDSNNDSDNDSDNETETNTQINTESNTNSSNTQIFNAESETELLIKKLYAPDNLQKLEQTLKQQLDQTNKELNLDESDIIKKDNVTTKKLKAIKQQEEREKKRFEKEKMKQNKAKEKQELREIKKNEKKIKKQNQVSTKYYEIDPSDIIEHDILIKRKRGRPKKADKIAINAILNI
jgi:transcription initiation factor TFIIIB Brf1 subunit/transcription initiation factor TFIIB